ncbi:MAG: SURF1 family cytochrome oxidase biogenesis protein [Pseudomonadota bacterium]|nr:SURF1 family cytochrome oxidase biogenesis protein [Pseudomonadota bacterium]
MIRKVPLIPTILVALAVAAMIGLGVWQLQRAGWKQRLLATYAKAESQPPITWPSVWPKPSQLPLFRHATGNCLRPVASRAAAGESLGGEPGYVLIVDCATGAEGPGMSVEIGWSKNPNARSPWRGGLVSGIIVPDRRSQMRLVAATPAPGLEASKPPSVETVSAVTPAGHKGYAATWFAFALIALVIYVLALRRRNESGASKP